MKERKIKLVLNKEHNIFGFVNGKNNLSVSIMHLDVDDLTSKGKTNSPYEISSIIFGLYSKMSKFFSRKKISYIFYGR